jgi:hypothetical protein
MHFQFIKWSWHITPKCLYPPATLHGDKTEDHSMYIRMIKLRLKVAYTTLKSAHQNLPEANILAHRERKVVQNYNKQLITL